MKQAGHLLESPTKGKPSRKKIALTIARESEKWYETPSRCFRERVAVANPWVSPWFSPRVGADATDGARTPANPSESAARESGSPRHSFAGSEYAGFAKLSVSRAAPARRTGRPPDNPGSAQCPGTTACAAALATRSEPANSACSL